jgi:hypothetical protein
MMNERFQNRICFCLFVLIAACAGPAAKHPPKARAPSAKNISGIRIVTDNGSHLAWSKKINKVAFDRLGPEGYFDLWVMNPDGTGQKCLTSNQPMLPNKHIGQRHYRID